MRIDAHEAKRRALAIVQGRLAKGWTREQIAATAYEGSIYPDPQLGYLLSAGRLSVPGVCRHGDEGSHTFKVADLFAEIDSPQGGLFA